MVSQEGGTLLVASRKEGQVWLMDLASDTVRSKVDTGPGSREIALSPDGTRAAVSNYGEEVPATSVTLVDVARGALITTIDLGDNRRPHGIAWPTNGQLFVTSERTRDVLEIDVARGVVRRQIHTLDQAAHMMAATADGRRGFVTSLAGAVIALDLESGEAIQNVTLAKGAEGMAVTDTQELWVAHRVVDQISVLDAMTLELLAVLPCPGYPIRVALQRGGQRLMVACPKRAQVAVFDTTARQEIARISFSALARLPGVLGSVAVRSIRSIPFGVLVHPDGHMGWVSHPKSNGISLVDLEKGAVVGRRKTCAGPDGMALSPVGPASSG